MVVLLNAISLQMCFICNKQIFHAFLFNINQIFHAFLFNIRNYSPEVINIILPRVNNFDIKQKKAWNICFIICHQHQTRSGKIKANKTKQILVNTLVFFRKS